MPSRGTDPWRGRRARCGRYRFGALGTAQFAALGSAQVASIDPAALASLSSAKLAAIGYAGAEGFGAALIAALSPIQIGTLGTLQILALRPDALAALSATQIAAQSPRQAASLSPDQIGSLATTQIAALPTADLAALLPAQVPGSPPTPSPACPSPRWPPSARLPPAPYPRLNSRPSPPPSSRASPPARCTRSHPASSSPSRRSKGKRCSADREPALNRIAGSVLQPRMTAAPEPSTQTPEEAARAARLRYVTDAKPGITRKPAREGFDFFKPDGTKITDEQAIVRIRKLAIPPAYQDVWICTDPNGHLQASGRDARGRKQYRYHPRWRETRDEAKYAKMLIFGEKLPGIRAQVERDLARPGLPREKVLAAIVRLLERTLARIGNEEYAKSNKSFGLTTLRNRHARISGTTIELDFRAKHGIQRHIELKDRRLATIIKRLQDLSGQDLFQYLDDDGARHTVGSDDVNDYLRAITGEDITAKDFRTWAGTNLAALALAEFEAFDSEAKAKKNVLRAVEAVATLLGNTPSICRKCYIHPAIFDGYLDGSLLKGIKARAEAVLDAKGPGLTAEEVAVVAFLDRRLGVGSAGKS